jgi:transposase
MIRIDAVWLALGTSDLRAGMDSLLGRVVAQFAAGAAKHTAYVFANKGAARLKILVYDGAGLWLCSRRLQSGRFVWPSQTPSARPDGDQTQHISQEQLNWLIAGAPWQHVAAPQSITRV